MESRYLLVRGVESVEPPKDGGKPSDVPLIKLDPAHPLTQSGTKAAGNRVEIPESGYQIEKMLRAIQADFVEEEHDEADAQIFEFIEPAPAEVIDVDDEDADGEFEYESGEASAQSQRPLDDWQHDPVWVNKAIDNLMPPPIDSSPSATMAVQREMRSMLKEQENATSLKELGWYMPPDLIGDNLFQWIVEMHSFEGTLPIAKDLKAK